MINVRCPKCGGKLNIDGNSMKCEEGHCYDIAREGYVNLLLVDKKNSLNPGDNKQMVASRDSFLKKGYYEFLAERLAETVVKFKPAALLDAGCGTGYYLSKILDEYSYAEAVGADISKEAVKLAAKRDKRAKYLVASVYDLPYDDGAFDFITCVFSPYAFTEYARVLVAGGILAVAYPAEKHLYEIKEILYGASVFENDKSVASEFFEEVETQTLTEKIRISDNNDLMSLIAMTPYFYKTKADKIDELSMISDIEVTVSFKLGIYRKK